VQGFTAAQGKCATYEVRTFEFTLSVSVRATARNRSCTRRACGGSRCGDPTVQRQHAESIARCTLLERPKVQRAMVETDQANSEEITLPYLQLRSPGGGIMSLNEAVQP